MFKVQVACFVAACMVMVANVSATCLVCPQALPDDPSTPFCAENLYGQRTVTASQLANWNCNHSYNSECVIYLFLCCLQLTCNDMQNIRSSQRHRVLRLQLMTSVDRTNATMSGQQCALSLVIRLEIRWPHRPQSFSGTIVSSIITSARIHSLVSIYYNYLLWRLMFQH